jgi:hypothetical protein
MFPDHHYRVRPEVCGARGGHRSGLRGHGELGHAPDSSPQRLVPEPHEGGEGRGEPAPLHFGAPAHDSPPNVRRTAAEEAVPLHGAIQRRPLRQAPPHEVTRTPDQRRIPREATRDQAVHN